MRLVTGSRLARWLLPPDRCAFTFGEWVFTRDKAPRLGVIIHEARHVEQFRELGLVGFFVLWLRYQRLYGYEENPLELDARAVSRRFESCGLAYKYLAAICSGQSPTAPSGRWSRSPFSRLQRVMIRWKVSSNPYRKAMPGSSSRRVRQALRRNRQRATT